MKKSIWIIIIALVVIVAGYLIIFSNSEDKPLDESAWNGNTIEFELTAKQWEFEPALIEVDLGDKVELHMESEDVAHGIVIPEYGISERLEPGEDVHAEFIADKAGTFNFLCNVPCGAGHSGMNGIIVVK